MRAAQSSFLTFIPPAITSIVPIADPPSLALECTVARRPHLAPPLKQNILVPKSSARRSSAVCLNMSGQWQLQFCP